MHLRTLAISAAAAALLGGSAMAAGNLAFQDPINVTLELAGSCNPAQLTFETGKLYNLTIVNSTDDELDFEAEGFPERIFTRKIQVWDSDGGKVAEIKGHITEMEILGGRSVEWWFVPVQTTRSPIEVECADGEAEFVIQ
jgi:hypothetical protein